MDTVIYFGIEFFNENSPIFQAEGLKENKDGIKQFQKIEGTDTTVSALNKQGYKLIQILHISDLLSVQLVLEKH